MPPAKGTMRDEYDFSPAERTPYAQASKMTVTLRLDVSTLEYFKRLSEEVNFPYETLIASCLADCAAQKRKS